MAETNKIVDAVDYIKRTNNISSTHEATAKLRKILYSSLWVTQKHGKLGNSYTAANNLNKLNVCTINMVFRVIFWCNILDTQNLLFADEAVKF